MEIKPKLWKRLKLRWQLVALLVGFLTAIQSVFLIVTYSADIKLRQNLAVEQSKTLNVALQTDLLRAIVASDMELLSDITSRIDGFRAVERLNLSVGDRQVFEYEREGSDIPVSLTKANLGVNETLFLEDFLVSKSTVSQGGFDFGVVETYFNLKSYQTGIREALIERVFLFLVQQVFAIFIALWLGQRFTQPFTRLAKAMSEVDVEKLHFPPVSIDSQNETGVLYDGYNELTRKVEHSTKRLKYLGEHDSLTGLLNRYAIEKEIEECLSNDAGTSHSLALLSVDQFQIINDSAGNELGDKLLKQTGLIIGANVLDSARIARRSGCNFMILLSHQTQMETEEQCRRVRHALNGYRIRNNSKSFEISVSMGLVHFKAGEYNLQSLLQAMDSAFYAAKEKGPGQLSIYSNQQPVTQQYSNDLSIVNSVREALGSSQSAGAHLVLHAQPIIPLQYQTDKISYEILVRLRDADGKLMYPDSFLGSVSRFSLFTELDICVLSTYFRIVCANRTHLDSLAFVNINLAGVSLKSEMFQDYMVQAIQTIDFPWSKLVLEVTETSAIGDLAQATKFIEFCRTSGIRIALDDFGTGMSSFDYLKHLPLDVVKIDGSFVRDMMSDPVDFATVKYVNEICKLRNQKTVAEFIESEEQAKKIREIGYDYGQGYYFSKPLPLTEIMRG